MIDVLNTPLRYKPEFQLPLRRYWLEKGISTLADLLTHPRRIATMEELQTRSDIKINFIDYHNINNEITDYLNWRGKKSEYSEPHPRNNAISSFLHMDKKGCSKLYKMIKDCNENVLHNISDVSSNEIVIRLNTFDISISFNLHHSWYKDTPQKILQTIANLWFFVIKKRIVCNIC